MDPVTTAVAIMVGLAGFFGAVLAISNKYLRVEEDPRFDRIEQMLPGSNCGACGQPGCRMFAESLVAGSVTPGKCTVSSPEGITAIATFLGIDAGFEEKRVARLHCAGGKSCVKRIAEYRGTSSCRAAVLVNGGGRACPWGCLGLADCEVVCTFDAIRMNDEGLPVVDVERCTACGDCVEVCPLDLFTLEPISHRILVQCATPLAGDLARSLCLVACDACGRCAVDAPPGVIEMRDGLPRLLLPAEAPDACTWRCPTGAIVAVDGNQFMPRRAAAARGEARVAP